MQVIDITYNAKADADRYFIMWKGIGNATHYEIVDNDTEEIIKRIDSSDRRCTLPRKNKEYHVRIQAFNNDECIAVSKYYCIVPRKIKRSESITDYTRRKFTNYNTRIDYDGYNWKKNNMALYEEVINLFPANYISRQGNKVNFHEKYYSRTGKYWLSAVEICDGYDKDDKPVSCKNEYKKKSEEAKEKLKNRIYSGDTVEKLKKINNYIIENTEYTKGTGKKKKNSSRANTVYGFLKGRTNCVGYSRTFKYLCDLNNIKCRVVISEEQDHAWNVVKLDGKWYVVDVTWNDTYYNSGYGKYFYFLVSDKHHAKDGEIEKPSYVDIRCEDDYRTWRGIIWFISRLFG